MFLLRDIFRSICRRKGFSLLTVAAGAFLFLLLGIYLGNLQISGCIYLLSIGIIRIAIRGKAF